MTIINPLPYTFVVNTVIDPTQVNADFAQIVNSTNTNAAHNGANSDITSLSGLTTPLSVAQGGTGSATAPGALTSLGAVAKAGDTMSGALTIAAGGYGLTVNNSLLVGAASQFNSNLTILGGMVAAGASQFNSNLIVYGSIAVPNGGNMQLVTLTSCPINFCALDSCSFSGGSATGTTLQSCAAIGGLSVTGGLTVASGLAVSSGDLVVNAGNAAVAGSLTVDATGTAIYVPNGNLVVAGTMYAGQSITTAAAGTAVYAPNGDIILGGTLQTGTDVVCGNQGFKPGGGAWVDSSDIRTKKAIVPYTRGLADVLKLAPVSFQHNGKGGSVDDGKTYIGLVADDVLPVMPEMIGTRKAKLDRADDHDTDILTLDATALIYALTNSVKELSARVAALEGKQA